MLDLREQDWKLIKNILSKYPYQFYAFGSRVKNNAKHLSDLDLCYKDNISDLEISNLMAELEESNLPFKVELINWKNCTPAFQKQIEKDLVPLIF